VVPYKWSGPPRPGVHGTAIKTVANFSTSDILDFYVKKFP